MPTFYRYANETFSGCDMTATICIKNSYWDNESQTYKTDSYVKTVGEIQTISYSINMAKAPVRSIGNVNAKDYVCGPRTIAGSLVFSVFNSHFSKDIMEHINSTHTTGTAYLVDELPPFDVVISLANEYGCRSRIVIYGIRLLNEGQVMSINDVYTENTYQYYATDIEYLTDEVAYSKSSNSNMLILANSKDTVSTKDVTPLEPPIPDYVASDEINIEAIPYYKNNEGFVKFNLSRLAMAGFIQIENINDLSNKLLIDIDDGLGIKTISTKIDPGNYSAYYEAPGIVSNTVKFKIKELAINENNSEDITLTNVTDSSATVYAKLFGSSISLYDEDDNEIETKDINDNSISFDSLTANTNYTIKSDTMSIKIKTLEGSSACSNFVSTDLLTNSDFDIDTYNTKIQEIKDESNSNTFIYSALKKKNEATNNDDKTLYLNILQSSIKYMNNISSSLDNIVSLPETINNINNIDISIDDNIDSLIIYQANSNKLKAYKTIYKNQFNNNKYNFVSKPGLYCLEAYDKSNNKSALKYFYIMNETERISYTDKLNSKVIINETIIDKIQTILNNYDKDLTYDDYIRLSMYLIKKADDIILFAPTILNITDSEIIIDNKINQLTANDNSFFLCLGTYQDLVNNDSIYKIPFTSNDTELAINKLLLGLTANKTYCIWIEDKEQNQISLPATFINNADKNSILPFEVKDIKDDINVLAKSLLDTDVYEQINSLLSSESDCLELIKEIAMILNVSMVKRKTINFMSAIKKYIGLYTEQFDSTFIYDGLKTNISYEFKTKKEGTLLIFDGEEIIKRELKEWNLIKYSDIKNNFFFMICIDKNFKYKSNVIVVNKKERYGEII